MKILCCVELFYPSVGGAQEVIKQLSSRFSKKGHEVNVATSYLPNRMSRKFNSVSISEFKVSGNLVNGISGEYKKYQNYVLQSDFDIILIYAAQQWTFDALIEVIDKIKAKLFFVPCGYSGLFDPEYKTYFRMLPKILRKFNACIYHAIEYRDYEFAKKNSIMNSVFIPNGANLNEFRNIEKNNAKVRMGISADEFLLMTNGSLNGNKGHLEITKAFAKLDLTMPITLLLNGNIQTSQNFSNFAGFKDHYLNKLNLMYLNPRKYISKLQKKIRDLFTKKEELTVLIEAINNKKYGKNKTIFLENLPRKNLINAYFASDIFLFASNIEYSPLVLYEACASGTPFISSDVGNAREIAKWTKGGLIAKTVFRLTKSYIDESDLNKKILRVLQDDTLAAQLSISGKKSIQSKYNWDRISLEYLKLFGRKII
jgi:glycosyltransferase involved in cell wall biosynthesis